jgi:prepilin-type N-terminal cleavage/methylation domain-containing protein
MTRRGFSLVELLITMAVLSIALVVLVPVTRRVASLSNQSTGRTQRLAALSGEVQRVEALPFDSLTVGTTCRQAGSSAPYTTCMTVTAVNDRTRLIVVSVAPIGVQVGPDTTVVERSRGGGANPLNLP